MPACNCIGGNPCPCRAGEQECYCGGSFCSQEYCPCRCHWKGQIRLASMVKCKCGKEFLDRGLFQAHLPCKANEYRVLCKVTEVDVTVERGLVTLSGNFDCDGWGFGGMGYFIDMDFLQSFVAVFGVTALQRVNGKSCWLVYDDEHASQLLRMEPLHRKDGEVFDIYAWKQSFKTMRPFA